MSGIFQNGAAGAPVRRHGADVWHVHGEAYRHSAAKFWSSLLDEVAEDYPSCDRVVLEGCDGAVFAGALLFPELELEAAARDADRLSLADSLRSAMVEMELYGYPGTVHARLYAGDTELLSRPMPMDCVDAEILPYLIVWLLEWSGKPESAWNDPRVAGHVAARDRDRGLAYAFEFELANRHLNEGLYQRQLTLRLETPRRSPAPEGAAT